VEVVVVSGETNAQVLRNIATAIVASGAPVKASTISEEEGKSRLVVSSMATGTANAISLVEDLQYTAMQGIEAVSKAAPISFHHELAGGQRYRIEVLDYQEGLSATYRLLDEDGQPLEVWDHESEVWAQAVTVDISGSEVTQVDTGRGLAFGIARNGGGIGAFEVEYFNSLLADTGTDSTSPMDQSSGGYVKDRELLDTHFTLDGLDILQGSNTVEGIIPGVTLCLLKAGQGLILLEIKPDTARILQRVSEFLAQFNTTSSYLKQRFSGNPGGRVDSFFRNLRWDMLSILQGQLTNAPTGYASLRDIGIGLTAQGTFSVLDPSLFTKRLSDNPQAVADLLASSNGLAQKISDCITPHTKLGTGHVDAKKRSINAQIAGLDRHISRSMKALERREEALRRQLSVMYDVLASLIHQQSIINSFLSGSLLGGMM